MSSGFISENVLEEKRKQRQEEWERVRQPDDPREAPEQPAGDSRSLFEQLRANKAQKDDEWQEQHQLKNQIRGIDDDEAIFLDSVDDIREKIERQRRQEEEQELRELRKTQAEMREKEEDERIKSEIKNVAKVPVKRQASSSSSSSSSSTQSKLLLGAVKRKKMKENEEEAQKEEESEDAKKRTIEVDAKSATSSSSSSGPKLGALAGLGDYASSSEDEDGD